ncbi:Cartilage-associated protein [Oryzias melastigma]|uniref:Cartilage-associated protein n=1 Tax=Oryzias melastigma TaxID=30732 RepID=A0A834F5R1_ORYME|nr:Cartilage-associated protein [Oryzias melastigma]
MKLLGLGSVLLALLIPGLARAQYEKYSFRSFPQKDIVPLETAYSYALEQYAAQNWAESVKYLELSLRLHRLLRDSEAFCSRNCSSVSRENVTVFPADVTLRVARHVLLRAACLKRCKEEFPVFKLKYPRRDLLQAFEERIPYRYIQFAHYQSVMFCSKLWAQVAFGVCRQAGRHWKDVSLIDLVRRCREEKHIRRAPALEEVPAVIPRGERPARPSRSPDAALCSMTRLVR